MVVVLSMKIVNTPMLINLVGDFSKCDHFMTIIALSLAFQSYQFSLTTKAKKNPKLKKNCLAFNIHISNSHATNI